MSPPGIVPVQPLNGNFVMRDHPIFADRFVEYQHVRLSRSPHTAMLGVYNNEVIEFDDEAEAEAAQFVIWTPGVVGAFIVTGLFSCSAVRRAVDEYGMDNVLCWRKGLRDADVIACPTAFIESDDGTVVEQLDTLKGIEVDSGLRFGLLTLSGDTRPGSIAAAAEFLEEDELTNVLPGKSVHAEMLFERPLDPSDPAQEALRLRIQRLLITLTRGDPAITGRARLMRAGGVTGLGDKTGEPEEGVRIQTLLRAEEVAFTAEAVDEALSRVCQARYGWSDDEHLKVVMQVLAAAGVLRRITVKQDNVDANRLHHQLRETLTWPADPEDSKLLANLTKRRRPQAGATRPAKGRPNPDASTSRWDLRTVQWEGLLKKAGIWQDTGNGAWHNIQCPFPHASSDKPGDTGVTLPQGGKPAGFKCFHASCQGRNVHDLLLHLEEELGEDELKRHVKIRTHVEGIYRTMFDRHRRRTAKEDPVTEEAAGTDQEPRWEPPGEESSEPPTQGKHFADTAGPLSEISDEIKIVIAHGDLGSGKTTWLAQEVAKVDRVTVIMHRQALSMDTAHAMNVTDYQQVDGPLTSDEHPKVVVTPNSFHRRIDPYGDPLPDDLVIMEESESTIRHMYGATMRKTRHNDNTPLLDPTVGELVGGDVFAMILERCKEAINGGGRVVLSDAFIDCVTDAFVEQLCKYLDLDTEQNVLCIDHEVQLDWKLHCYEEKAELVHRIGQDVQAGKRVVVACTSARDAVALAEAGHVWVRDDGSIPTVLCHHRGQKQTARDALKQVRESWANNDIVIYSPVVDSGVNYDRADRPFDRRYLLGARPRSNRTGTPVPGFGWRELLQMSRRVRDHAVNDPDIHAWLDPSWRHSYSCEPEDIREDMITRSKHAVAMAPKTAPDGTPYTTALRDPEHFEVAVAVEEARHLDTVDVPFIAREAFAMSGVQIVEHETELDKEALSEFRQRWKDLKDQHDRQTALAWFHAGFLSTKDYMNLRHKTDLKDDQQASVARTKRLDFFGPTGAELERLEADLRGEERAMVRRHVRFRLICEGHLARAAAYDRATVEAGYSASMTLAALQSCALRDLLQMSFPKGFEIKLGGIGLPGYNDSEAGTEAGPTSVSSQDKWGQAADPQQAEKTAKNTDDQPGPNPGSPIDLEDGDKPPQVVWVTVPKGATLAYAKKTVGFSGVVDAQAVMEQTREAIHDGVGIAVLAGSAIPTSRMKSPNAFVKQLWKAAGYKVSLWKDTRVGPQRKKVRLYTLDPEWIKTLKQIAHRHYDLAMGHTVLPLEQVDPKAAEQRKKYGKRAARARRRWSFHRRYARGTPHGT